jgi:hypothetical protein
MYRPDPQDGFPQDEYYFYITYVEEVEDTLAEERPAEGDYEDPHFQAWLDKMEERERLLEEAPW